VLVQREIVADKEYEQRALSLSVTKVLEGKKTSYGVEVPPVTLPQYIQSSSTLESQFLSIASMYQDDLRRMWRDPVKSMNT
jgi:hypothetical protein